MCHIFHIWTHNIYMCIIACFNMYITHSYTWQRYMSHIYTSHITCMTCAVAHVFLYNIHDIHVHTCACRMNVSHIHTSDMRCMCHVACTNKHVTRTCMNMHITLHIRTHMAHAHAWIICHILYTNTCVTRTCMNTFVKSHTYICLWHSPVLWRQTGSRFYEWAPQNVAPAGFYSWRNFLAAKKSRCKCKVCVRERESACTQQCTMSFCSWCSFLENKKCRRRCRVCVRTTSHTWYGVATISRLLTIVGLFCKRAL